MTTISTFSTITTISIMLTLLTRKVNLVMSLGILAGLVIHVSFNWLIDMVIIIVIIIIIIIIIIDVI